MGASHFRKSDAPSSDPTSTPQETSESMSLNFPSVELLMHSVLPIHGCATTFEDLLSAWEQVFSVNRINVLWVDEITGCGTLMSRSDAGTTTSQQFPGIVSLSAFEAKCLSEQPGMQVCHLSQDDDQTPNASFLLPQSFNLATIPANWLAMTKLLTQTAIGWERQQTNSRLEAMAEYAAGAGHEINNPLGTITGRVGQLLKSEDDPEKRRMLEMIGAQAYRVRDMIGDSMVFARPPAPNLESLTLSTIIKSGLLSVQPLLSGKQIDIQLTGNSEFTIEADHTQLCIVISELVKNAIEAIPDSGTIQIHCEQTLKDSQPTAYLQVSDTGVGMTEEEWQHCLNPFYSGRQAGRGLGFGLSKCWRITQMHNGFIDHSQSEQGTAFHVWLPTRIQSR